MEKTINHKIFVPHAPEEVWEYLTKPELIELWLMKNDFQPTVGHQFRFTSRPLPAFDFDGNIYCTVMEVTPFTKLSYSWKGGPGDGRITLDSVVEWTLRPKDNGTELEIVHNGFKILENMMMFTAMNEGWLKNMNKIEGLINTAKNATANA